ncbi:hypothetical protein AHF37_02416 [Paragonimus kellicotti]|nr:hypothetical protein AHF37_02416 [Paragonimus kellicotti]
MDIEGLIWAVKNGDMKGLQERSQSLTDINCLLGNGRSLLHYAADYGQTEICEYLLTKGANINCPDKYGVTPLLAAVYEDHVACAKLLLNKGAKLLDTPDGSSYLDIARSPDLQKLLRDYGAV